MTTLTQLASFHDRLTTSYLTTISGHYDSQFTYTFSNFFHPFVGDLISKINKDALPGMLDAKWQEGLKQDFFQAL